MSPRPARNPLRSAVRFIGLQNLGLAVSILLLLGTFGVLGLTGGREGQFEGFLAWDNMEATAMLFILEAIMALGMTLVIISGGIDLSVGAVLPFSAILVGILLNWGLPIPLAMAITLFAACLIGCFNASMKNLLQVHPFIATLATMLTLKGVNLAITEKGALSGFPEEFGFLGQGRLPLWPGSEVSIPIPLVLFFVLAVAIGFLLKNHRFFQQVYFIGGNPRAARVSGIKVERFLIFVYVLSAGLAGLAGIVAASQYGSANSTFGQNAELKVITAVVIGGASLSGGRGSVLGTVLGIFFLAIVYNGFFWIDVNPYWEQVVTGAMLMVAVFLGEFLKKRGTSRRQVGLPA